MYRPTTALVLASAVALNWTWGRVGGAIQSEPVYLFWELLAVLVAIDAGRRGSARSGIGLGLALAACVLVRQIGICLVAAALVDLGLHRRWRGALVDAVDRDRALLPWFGWLVSVRHNTQAELLLEGSLVTTISGQAMFYLQRLPDQITGPVVEIGTVFHSSTTMAVLVNLWAVAATGVMILGWAIALKTHRRRLASLVAFATLALLLVWPFTEAGRFLVPLVPFLLVGATEGLGG